MLQLLLLAMFFFIHNSHSHDNTCHHMLRTREGRVLVDECTHPSSTTSLYYKKCHPKRYHNDTNWSLSTIFSGAARNFAKGDKSVRRPCGSDIITYPYIGLLLIPGMDLDTQTTSVCMSRKKEIITWKLGYLRVKC